MKIRTDFVSNSSSSSFVFSANFKKFGFDDFVKAVCEQCDDGENDNRLRGDNEAILRYCLKYFELLYIGELVKGRKTETYRRGYDYCGEKITDPTELECSPFAINKREYIDHPSRCYEDGEHTTAKMLSDDVIEVEYDDFAPSGVVVPRHYMTDVIRSSFGSGGRKAGVEEIMKVLTVAKAGEDDLWRTSMGSSTYLITKNTIANTRDLIAEGYDIRLSGWQNLDALEARISAGETVFHIECSDAGEGEEDTRLFSHASRYPFKDLPLEDIRGSAW